MKKKCETSFSPLAFLYFEKGYVKKRFKSRKCCL
jgi:hypothetical protein